ncbi:MAG: hypothetical protein JWO36_779 [Myxococcales bacterium]|nr:hypothetical protein [Myxococcales bacterium]
MAHPGYPQHGQMQQPGGFPQPGAPQMQMQQRQIRRGTSKAVPVVVSAGLAVGVFCGLLFGVGTGKDAGATTTSSSSSDTKTDATDAKKDTPAVKAAVTPPATETKTGSGAAVAATTGTGSAATTPAVAKLPDAVTPKTVKLTVQIKPDAAASGAKITVDGKEIAGTSVEIPLDANGKKSVKVAATAPGYHSIDQQVELEVGTPEGTKLQLELRKRGGGGGGGDTTTAAVPTSGGSGSKTSGTSSKGTTGTSGTSGGTKTTPPATGGKKTGGKKPGLIDI